MGKRNVDIVSVICELVYVLAVLALLVVLSFQIANVAKFQVRHEAIEGAQYDALSHRLDKINYQLTVMKAKQEAQVTAHGTCLMSYYGGSFHGRRTASGERFDKNAMTCAADPSIPMGAVVQARLASRGGAWRSMRVTDRGDFAKYGRKIDASEGAFRAIVGSTRPGVARVEYRVLKAKT